MRFENKMLIAYFGYAAKQALEGKEPYLIQHIWDELKQLPEDQLHRLMKGDRRLLKRKWIEDFQAWRWWRAERFYLHGPAITVSPLERDAWFSIRSALEEFYISLGYIVPSVKYYDLTIQKDGKTYQGLITPRFQLIFIGDVPEEKPLPYFSIYKVDNLLGEMSIPIYQARIKSALVPLLSGGIVNESLIVHRV
ncbi:MAG: hypothetical protein GXN92_03770 [Candidatus Micrarchaeota archaeon]|nr:hypothetical protein [Candidatus Micrarchaeota archaeon]